ncbi:TIGR04104 family putative zinc finger protein [Ectobacillus ponti]|uniref:CXXC-20-CXXC protein n=1 Tax=Ectobacillus ponti TaxID=2961894 RepID=A0AA41XBG0_9BACI|nr:TIGR04104 family putative zinc finger protein [Ectobacillus ponti]MCP8969803.1 hypothetical protein [Ectobacillus ponti]
MPTCIHCRHSFSWGEIFYRILVRKGDDIGCPACKGKMLLTARAKKRLFSLMSLLPVLFVFLTIAKAPELVTTIILLVAAAAAVITAPFVVEVTDREQTLF